MRVGRPVFHSFRAQVLAGVLAVLPLLALSAAWVLYSTIRLQDSMNRGFGRQLEIRSLQLSLEDYQAPLLDYLATRSSNALSDLLVRSQNLRSSLPPSQFIPADPLLLQEVEVHSLILSYLDLTDRVIDEKRGLDVAGYTSLYERSREALEYIDERIEAISSARLAEQAGEYRSAVERSRSVQSWNLAFILSISVFSALVILAMVDKIARPMSALSDAARRISSGDFEGEDVSLSSISEMDGVIGAFNRMKRDIHTYVEELKWQRRVEQEYLRERVRSMRLEGSLRRMELYTMQAQMNPHFLFNSLNTGIQLAIVEGAERTGDYMDRLSTLLRHNIREKAPLVPLRHEIEGLESYFWLLKVRFPKNLDLVLDCPEEFLDRYEVPVTILQPLVENCVVHAFRGVEREEGERNSIEVRVRLEGNRLELTVSDNGRGMESETVDALLKRTSPRADAFGEGGADGAAEVSGSKVMGLENVVQRLRLFWPDDPEVVAIESQVPRGTTVRIKLQVGSKPCIPC